MIIPMTAQLQAVILAVQLFRKWRHANDCVFGYEIAASNQRERDVWSYFNSLPLPGGLEHCRAFYEAVLTYPIEKTLNTQAEDLPKRFAFGF